MRTDRQTHRHDEANGHFLQIFANASRESFKKKPQIPDFIKICPTGAELFYADGRTDTQTYMTKLMVTFCKFLRTHLKTKKKSLESKFLFKNVNGGGVMLVHWMLWLLHQCFWRCCAFTYNGGTAEPCTLSRRWKLLWRVPQLATEF